VLTNVIEAGSLLGWTSIGSLTSFDAIVRRTGSSLNKSTDKNGRLFGREGADSVCQNNRLAEGRQSVIDAKANRL
jgi:hypothetical protein